MSSTSYPADSQDWRGRFIASMATAVAAQPGLMLSLWAPPGERPEAVLSVEQPGEAAWLQWLAAQGGIAHMIRQRKPAALYATVGLLFSLGRVYRRQRSNVVHVNWLQNALPLWGTNTPALITVLGTDFALLKLPGMRFALRTVLRQRRAILAPNAAWMCPALEEAFGDLAEVRPIPFGVDAAWLNLVRAPVPDGVHRWLAITRLTAPKLGDLFAWGEGLFNARRQLHLFGPMQDQVELPHWVHYHGPTHPAELLSEWFPKASGLITLSRHDEGCPQVMLEAMAAGLPVLASQLPAHRAMVQHRETGWLADSRDELSQGLDWLENRMQNQQTGQTARRWVQDSIGTWDDCAGRYATAYQDLLGSKA